MSFNEDEISALKKVLSLLANERNFSEEITLFQSPPDTVLATNVLATYSARLLYVESGELFYKINGQDYNATSQEVVAAGQHCKFEVVSLSGSTHEFILSHPGVWYIKHEQEHSSNIFSIRYMDTETEKQFVGFWRSLTLFSEAPSSYRRIKSSCLSRLIFNEMQHYLNTQSSEGPADNDEALFLSILSFMAKNLKLNITRLDICEKFKLTYKEMSTLFMHWQRCNFKQMLIQLRLNNARGLLVTTDKSIGEITGDCGFNSPDHFIYCFRQIFGMSPYQLKKRTLSQKSPKKEDRIALHEMAEFHFLKEYGPEDTPGLVQDLKRIDRPTVCYFANETGEERYLYEIHAGSRVYVATIANYRRFRFNVDVGTEFRVKNKQGEDCSSFIVEDRLCQGVFTL